MAPTKAGMSIVIKYPAKDKATAKFSSIPYGLNNIISVPSLVPNPLIVIGIKPTREAIG